MSKIQSIHAREILSSGGTPSLEVTCELENGTKGKASVPYGASAGSKEAQVVFDGDATRYKGKGMLKAVGSINEQIAPELVGKESTSQREIDEFMNKLDGTPNKANFGGNAILGVSLAVARASAEDSKMSLYKYIRQVFGLEIAEYRLPNPMMVVIEGGKHADNSTDLQEYIISPIGNDSVKENVRRGLECYFKLKEVLKENGYSTNVGNEGAFAPDGIKGNTLPLEMMAEAVTRAGLELGTDVGFSLDAAASEFYENGKYNLSVDNLQLTSTELSTYFTKWLERFPIITMEDMHHEADWAEWQNFVKVCRENSCELIGDDLTVTNSKILQEAIDKDAITSILIKLNQIGSLTETVDTCMLARKHGMMTVPSHRGGGETDDTSMVDLAVAVNSGFIKVGPTRGERVVKYNRLMEIEAELGTNAAPMGMEYNKVF